MSLDEWAFEKVWRAVNNKKPTVLDPYTVSLEKFGRVLEISVLAMTGVKVRVIASDKFFLDDEILGLPEAIRIFEDYTKNTWVYHHLAIYLCWARSSSAQGAEAFYQEYPNLRVFISEHQQVLQGQEYLLFGERIAFGEKDQVRAPEKTNKAVLQKLSDKLLEVKTAAKAKIKKIRSESENPLVHVFEKLLSLDSFTGGDRRTDGSDESDLHQEALNEVKLEYVIRTNETADTMVISQAEIESSDEAESLDLVHTTLVKYPEWDYRKASLKMDWCSVFEQTGHDQIQIEETTEVGTSSINYQFIDNYSSDWKARMRDRIEWYCNSRSWSKRQLVGSELDIDQLVDYKVTMTTGARPVERIYQRLNSTEKSIGLVILVDCSQSTDSYISDRRLIDISKDAIHILSQILADEIQYVELASFFSETRKSCHYRILKSQSDSWQTGLGNLDEVEPQGYTRIGTSLRHANFRFESMKVSKKVLVLITDAKPTDYDRYEGVYGIQDVRHASDKLKANRVQFLAMTHDQQKNSSMYEMFGNNHFGYFKSSQSLVESIVEHIVKTR